MIELASRYQLLRPIGEGGMGIVHEALDRQLGRRVAIKMIRSEASDDTARERFMREARAAASISHPNVCLLHEVGEHAGHPFLVMELLEGEPLSERLARGPMPLEAALEIVLPILSALSALHARGLVHRDLKPSNIFLTVHGVKLLDFGLARQTAHDPSQTASAITLPGTLSGTPRYMAPEQITGDPIDARTDLFAAGIVLYEIVAGRLPYAGTTTLDLLNAILRLEPPPLSPTLAALEPVLRRALQRRPDDRFASADAMAAALRPLISAAGVSRASAPPPPPAARVVVLPFRLLRPDEEVAFLERALPEAITATLAAVPSLCVRSNLAALGVDIAGGLARLAQELDVDHVLTGTLLRSGDQLRITSQLIETPSGRVRWSQTAQRPLGDLFELQDGIATEIVKSLPLDRGETTAGQKDTPATARAYELYLRANQLAMDHASWLSAREMYEQCVAEDPKFAPAWARLGRMHRIISKYAGAGYRASYAAAEAAFQRAFALNPDLSLAHHLYVYLEVETGRAAEALIRVVGRLQRAPNQAELYAALCHAARYCGLLEASAAAHQSARRLDPAIQTSVAHTYYALQDYAAVLRTADDQVALKAMASIELGGSLEQSLQAIEAESAGYAAGTPLRLFNDALVAVLTGDRETVMAACQRLFAISADFPDGEAVYIVARMLARAERAELAIEGLRITLLSGFFAYPFFARDPWLDSVRDVPEFQRLLAQARERFLAADAAFQAAGGYRMLGVAPPSVSSRSASA